MTSALLLAQLDGPAAHTMLATNNHQPQDAEISSASML
jgi:hypothetical protein